MRFGVVLALIAIGCSDPGSRADAEVGDANVAVASPTAPTSPAAPRFACASGWRSADDEGTTICEPFSTNAAPSCAPLEIASVGGPSDCRPALPCPSGPWPDTVPAGAVYVLAGASGDGTRDHPVGTLAQGVSLAGSAGTVVIGEGSYREWLTLDGTVALVGVCPERVSVIDPAATQQAAIVVRSGASPTLRGLRLQGGNHGLWLLHDASARVEGVVIEAPQPILLEAASALTADGARVSSSSTSRDAIVLFPGAHATLAHAHLSGGAAALHAEPERGTTGPGDAQIALTDSAILDTGDALLGGISGTLERVAIERVQLGALVLPSRELSMTDVRARTIRGSAGFLGAFGTVHLHRVAVTDLADRSTPAAVLVVSELMGAPASLDGSDVFVARSANVALSVASATAVTLDHLALRSVGGGVQVRGEASVSLTDVEVATEGPASADPDRPGHALEIAAGTLTLDRAVLRTHATRAAALIVQAPATASAHDIVAGGGIGIVAQCGADPCDAHATTLTLGRARIADAAELGLEVFGVSADVVDVDVDGVAVGATSLPGFGVVAAGGGHVTLTRARVARVSGAGLASLQGGSIDASSVEVTGTAAFVLDGQPDRFWGDGLVCGSDGGMRLAGFDVHGSARAGLSVSFGCGASSWRGTLAENAIGILNDERLSTALDFSGITLRDNTVSFDSLTLEVPALDPAF